MPSRLFHVVKPMYNSRKLRTALSFLQEVHRGNYTALDNMIAQRHDFIVRNRGTDSQFRKAVIALAHLVYGRRCVEKAILQASNIRSGQTLPLTSEVEEALVYLTNTNPGRKLNRTDVDRFHDSLWPTYGTPIFLVNDPDGHSERFPCHDEFEGLLMICHCLRNLTTSAYSNLTS